MTSHLTDEERIDALDGVLPAGRQRHLDACDECREALAGLSSVYARLMASKVDDLAEPSPLFWEHFPARVAGAVTAVEAAAVPWWRGSPRAWMALATATAIVVIALVLPRPDVPPVDTGEVADVAMGVEPLNDTVQWQFVAGVLDTLDDADVHEVLRPSSLAIASALETLSPAERDAFAQLLEAELAQGSD